MAENISTLVLKVNPGCHGCCKKVLKTLSKYITEIKSYEFDEEQKIVTISGPFDPVSFSSKLQSKAGKAIKSIEIKPVEVPTPAPEAPEPAEEEASEPEAPNEPARPELIPIEIVEPDAIGYPTSYSQGYGYGYGMPPPQGYGYGYEMPPPQGYGYGYEMPPPPQGYGYGYEMPPPPPQPVPGGHSYDGYNYGNGERNNDEFDAICQYFSVDNPNSCTIM